MEHAPDPRLERVGRDGPEQRRRPHLVVHVGAGRAAADRVHPRQVGGGTPEGVHDLVDVPLRVRLVRRVPQDLLAEHHLAVDHGGGLAIARTEVEADPAAIEMAAQGDGGLALGRELGLRDTDDLERDAEQLRPHERGVEDARGLGRVVPGQERDQGGRPVDVQPRAAARPQQELAQALHGAIRGGLVRVARRVHPRLPVPGGAGRLLDGQRDPDPDATRLGWRRGGRPAPGTSTGSRDRAAARSAASGPPSCRSRPVEPARARA